MDIRRQVGRNIAQLRHKQGLSQEDLEHESGIHRTYISGVERGIRNPTITVLKQIADGLKVPLARIVRDTQPLTSTKRLPKRRNL